MSDIIYIEMFLLLPVSDYIWLTGDEEGDKAQGGRVRSTKGGLPHLGARYPMRQLDWGIFLEKSIHDI